MVCDLGRISGLDSLIYSRFASCSECRRTTVEQKLIPLHCSLGDVLHTALLIHALYTYTIIWFGQYLELQTIVWSLEGTLPLAGVIAFVVQVSRIAYLGAERSSSFQTYFCLRIQRVTQTWTFATGCWILALVRMILCFVLTAEVVAVGVFTILQAPKSQALGLATLCIGAVSDVLVAGFICKGLLGVRSGLRTTDKLLDKLVAYTIGGLGRAAASGAS